MPRKLCAPSELSCQSMQSNSGDGQPATARRAQRERLASNPSRAPAQRRRHRHGARRKVQTIPSRHRLRCAVAANGTPISTKESRPCGRACGLHLDTGLRSLSAFPSAPPGRVAVLPVPRCMRLSRAGSRRVSPRPKRSRVCIPRVLPRLSSPRKFPGSSLVLPSHSLQSVTTARSKEF